MNVRMYSRPSLDDWLAHFLDVAANAGLKDTSALTAEAQRVFDYYNARNWRDKEGSQIKFWPRIVELSVEQFKRKQSPGYVAPKRIVKIVDCCWMPDHLCQCASLVYDDSRTLLTPQDFVAASLDIKPHEAAAFAILNSCRSIHTVHAAIYADDQYLISTATDIGRGHLDHADGTFSTQANSYFSRAAAWIEFAILRRHNWCRLADEISAAYHAWLVANNKPSLFRSGESVFDFAQRIHAQLISRP